MNDARHQAQLEKSSTPTMHIHLSVRSTSIFKQGHAPYLWKMPASAEADQSETTWAEALEEGQQWIQKYNADVQFVFSHVQHHWHGKNERGERVPLHYCRVKGKRNNNICKRGYPKKVLRNHDKSVKPSTCQARVVCQGVAAELDLKTSGQRNALGSIAGTRHCPYFCSTAKMLASVARSNTNIQVNYRVPITEFTHNRRCKSKSGTRSLTNTRLCLIAQRAMKQMMGYFGGYISKRQKMGQFELKKSIAALPLLKQKLAVRNLKSASVQLAHVTNRMFTTLEGKGILRASTEEFMLASQYKAHDPLSAEFVRSFRIQHFHGKHFLDRYDALESKASKVDVRLLLPRAGGSQEAIDQVAAYGFRSNDPNLFYLSPWEFCQWFIVHKLRAPSQNYNLTHLASLGEAKAKRKMLATNQNLIFESLNMYDDVDDDDADDDDEDVDDDEDADVDDDEDDDDDVDDEDGGRRE